MRFINKLTGAVLKPKSEQVSEMYANSECFALIDEEFRDYSKMSKTQLLMAARSVGLKVKDKQNKGELVKLLEQAGGGVR